MIDELLQIDEIWRKKKYAWEQFKKEFNDNQKKITEKKKVDKAANVEEELKRKSELEV